MRRLTLILSDLYVPEDVARANSPAAFELPSLTWLLRFSRPPASCPDWRAWIAAQTGHVALARSPLADIAARAWVDPASAAGAWIATPVHLEARLDHVRLADRGLLRIGTDEANRWSEAFAREFGPDLKLHPAGERGFVLTGIEAGDTQTTDPARLLDSDVAPALPRGAGASALRRLGAELEMWLHAIPLNDERQRAGQRRISAFWFWGGEKVDKVPGSLSPPASSFVIHGEDLWLAGLAHATGSTANKPAADFGTLDPSADHHIVELAPMSAPHESLVDAEARWFAPARTALSEGKLAALDIVANDRWFRIGSRAGWRWWRGKRDWFESINRPTVSKA
jgi:hypothetical protein